MSYVFAVAAAAIHELLLHMGDGDGIAALFFSSTSPPAHDRQSPVRASLSAYPLSFRTILAARSGRRF